MVRLPGTDHRPERRKTAVKTACQHHVDQLQARSGENGALRLYVQTYIQLNMVEMVKLGPKSDVPSVDVVSA